MTGGKTDTVSNRRACREYELKNADRLGVYEFVRPEGRYFCFMGNQCNQNLAVCMSKQKILHAKMAEREERNEKNVIIS